MASRSIYRYANIYNISAICKTPVHVGSANGEKGEVLIHPVEGNPFIQASGIAGAFRDYAEKHMPGMGALWFGDPERNNSNTINPDDFRSRLVFSDGIFTKGKFAMELRTRVRINPETGSTAKASGGDKSGQLLQTEYISKGSEVKFTVYEFYKDETEKRILEDLLKALDSGNILLGGQVSNGCGSLTLQSVSCIACDMKTSKGRKDWASPDKAIGKDKLSAIRALKLPDSGFVDFKMDLVFDRMVLVKGERISQEKIEEATKMRFQNNDRLPDKMMLMDGQNNFIIPGSSFKGVFRSHIESILTYLNIDKEGKLKEQAFENQSQLFFYDSFVDGGMNIEVRTHLDKFTGSVMDKALFKEAVNGGKDARSSLHVRLKKTGEVLDQQLMALVLLTMRDCALGFVTVGSGYSIGRGFMTVEKISVKENDQVLYSNNLFKGKIIGDDNVKAWLETLKVKEGK